MVTRHMPSQPPKQAGTTTTTMDSPPPSSSDTFTVHTSLLFDPTTLRFLKDRSLTISPSTGNIISIHQRTTTSSVSPADIDLRDLVVLPGLVDAHSHVFLHSYLTNPALYQMRDEPPVERIVRATQHLRRALAAGYTTYRDLGTEGLGDADVHLRDAVARGLTPGPRMLVATECLASSGSYEIRVEGDVKVPRICDPCDGVDGVRAAVRRRVGAGADVVKVYADYRRRRQRVPLPTWPGAGEVRFPPRDPNPNSCLWTQEELDAAVQEAKRARAPVAIHASSAEGVIMAAKARPTSVEHGYERSDDAIRALKEAGCIFVPTLSIVEQGGLLDEGLPQTRAAFKAGVKIAAGGDGGGGVEHGDNVREVELLIEAGLPVEEALAAATINGWEACGGDLCGRRFGWLQEGWAADLIALRGDPREDLGALRKVDFVMKDGKVYKKSGKTTFDD